MERQINSDTGYCEISVSDARIKCDVRGGPITLILGNPGSNSIDGVVINKIGNENSICISPNKSKGVNMGDGIDLYDIFKIPSTKQRKVVLKYNTETKLWVMI